MDITKLPPPPRSTANPAPLRPLDSVRRTSSIDVSWPEGIEKDRLMIGRARDLLTPADGRAPRVLNEAGFQARLAGDKTINAIHAEGNGPDLSHLVGERGGGHLRMVLRETMPQLLAGSDPIYLVLDDISGSALVSAFAWLQWFPDWMEKYRESMSTEEREKMTRPPVNVCWGLQEGNSGTRLDGSVENIADADGGDLRNPADPDGWHFLPESDGPGFRRARRIDVVRDEDAGLIRIDSAFQDTAKLREGGRVAIHEYRLAATVDLETLEIRSLEPEARILPFSECPGAIRNTQRLVGRKLPEIRDEVLELLRGPEGCTHLNDALRALADVPRLASHLREPA
jgi:hypothetical protein